jgi:uncharacterized repeat protein (TIGR03833 family)
LLLLLLLLHFLTRTTLPDQPVRVVDANSMSRRQHNNHNRRNGNGNENGNANNAHLIGSTVSVVQKHDQGTGHLTSGVVSEILTNSASHPRGIKVRLVDGTVGRIADASQQTDTYEYSAADEGPSRAKPSLADFMVARLPNRTINPPSAEWACPACTFVNSGLLPKCELCQTTRP